MLCINRCVEQNSCAHAPFFFGERGYDRVVNNSTRDEKNRGALTARDSQCAEEDGAMAQDFCAVYEQMGRTEHGGAHTPFFDDDSWDSS